MKTSMEQRATISNQISAMQQARKLHSHDWIVLMRLIGEVLTLLDTLSQSLTEAQGEIARLTKEHEDLLTRSGKPDVERDFSIHAAMGHERLGMEIALNGRTVLVGEPGGLFPTTAGQVSYEDVVEWAGHGQGRILSVTYSTRRTGDKQRQGSLSPGKSTLIEDGMVFNVSDTSNA